MAVEPVSFAQNEVNAIRNEVTQAFQTIPPNLDQCLRRESIVIVLYLRFLKNNFDWNCTSGPGDSDLTCTRWALAVDT